MPRRSRLLLLIGWGLALVFFCSTALLAWWQVQPIPRVTAENIQKVKIGMTLREVESILGPGRDGHLPMEFSDDRPVSEKAIWKHWPGPDLQTNKDVVYNFPFVDDKLVQFLVTSRTGNWEWDEAFIHNVNTGQTALNDQIYRGIPGRALHLYEYHGGYVDCWIEVAAEGKREVIALISAQEMRKNVDDYFKKRAGRKIPPEHVRGYIFWDPYSLGQDDPTLIVSCMADGNTMYPPVVIKGTNHLIAEKWKNGTQKGWYRDLQRGVLPPGVEKLLEAQRFSFGEHRLMVKLVVGSN